MAARLMGWRRMRAGVKAVLWAALLASTLTTAVALPTATAAHAESEFCGMC